MFWDRLLAPNAAKASGRRLYAACAAQARTPWLYLSGGAPDTIEARFELYSMHVALLLLRLQGHGRKAGEVSQVVFDAYVRALDDTLREVGVADLAVGRKMRNLGAAFYGRARAYQTALAGESSLADLIARTVLQETDKAPEFLARYVTDCRDSLNAQELESLLSGEVTWPARP